MKYDVSRKQYTTKYCFICGEENQAGLRMRFYEISTGEVVGIFTGRAREHCSYPDRLHGGIISAILDETIGRAIEQKCPGTLGVTTQLSLKFRKPVPLGVELRAIGRLTRDTNRGFEGSGEILLADGAVAASCQATYAKLPLQTTLDSGEEKLFYHKLAGDKTSIER